MNERMNLIERIESGMSTETDARIVSKLMARLAGYELALREIAAYGQGDAAMLACRALAGDHREPARAA